MLERLPDWITPVSLAEREKELAGSMGFTGMQRLAPLLHGRQESLQVHLHFGVDDAGIRYLNGDIRGAVVMTCQRCLAAITVPIHAEMRLGIVTDIEAGERLPVRYEPLLATRDPVRLAELIEDELLLCLPAVPVHAESEHCEPPKPLVDEPAQPVKENPFAALAQLKHKS